MLFSPSTIGGSNFGANFEIAGRIRMANCGHIVSIVPFIDITVNKYHKIGG